MTTRMLSGPGRAGPVRCANTLLLSRVRECLDRRECFSHPLSTVGPHIVAHKPKARVLSPSPQGQGSWARERTQSYLSPPPGAVRVSRARAGRRPAPMVVTVSMVLPRFFWASRAAHPSDSECRPRKSAAAARDKADRVWIIRVIPGPSHTVT